MELLSTREIATIFWLIILGIFLILYPKIRKNIVGIIKTACSKKLLVPFFILIIYSIAIALLLSITSIWQIAYVKVIVIWTLFVGVPVCFKAFITPLEINYFKKVILDGFAITVLLEYFTGLFTFNLLIEILIVPIIAFVYLMYIYLEYNNQEPELKSVFSKILTIILVIFLIYTFIVAIEKYPSLDMVETLVTFLIPIIYSLVFIPAIYLFGVFGKYDMIFTRIRVINPSDEQIKKNYKKKIFYAFGLSYTKLSLLEKKCMREIYRSMSYEEFNEFILKLKDNSS